MKAPISWLREFVEIDCSVDVLAERLTFSGLEVEDITIDGANYNEIVIARVLSVEPHPKADNLLVCVVHDGQRELKVVCGARNFGIGNKIPFAGSGTVLHDGRKIEKESIRGIISEGMLCAEDELGLSDDHSGLMILPSDAPVGKPLSEIMGPPESVLHMEITPNRGDCLSIIGIAREIAALYGKRLKLPSFLLEESETVIEEKADVIIEDKESCPRYTARLISGIKLGSSPLWMRRRLTQCGVRAINNIVDITNYVMMESGHPLHAFDHSLIDSGKIIVRRARNGERIITLEGAEHSLTPDMLIIADSRGPVALAGVMGGLASAISDSTQSVLLESACFKPAIIRQASKALGISSESSRRFEHGIDIQFVEWASRRAAAFINPLSGGRVAKGVIDAFPSKPKQRKIVCRFDRIRKLLGIKISKPRIVNIFRSLELNISESDKKSCVVNVPSFRMDLENEADLIEEIARLHGLENIPSAIPHSAITPDADDSSVRAAMLCKSRLCGLGLSEIMNYSFVSEDLLNIFDAENIARRVILPRPVSTEQAILRNSLLPQVCDTLRRNCSRQIETAALFEVGRVFFKNEKNRIVEENRLAAGLMGPVGPCNLDTRSIPSEENVFLWLKGVCERLCHALGLHADLWSTDSIRKRIVYSSLNDDETPSELFPTSCLEPKRSVSILLDGSHIGVIGLLKRSIRNAWRMRMPVALLEAKLEPLLQDVFTIRSAKPFSVYPSISRDVAIIVRKNITHANVLDAIRKIAPTELTEVKIFDIYHSKELGVARKGMAYSLRYCSENKTLTDDEVNDLHTAIKEGIRTTLEAEIREG